MLSHLISLGDLGDGIVGAAAVVGGAALILGALLKARKVVKRIATVLAALHELLFGRDEQPANEITGAPAMPAVPGIGVQLAQHIEAETAALEKVSGDVARLTDAVAKIADQSAVIADHERRLGLLEAQAVERIVTKAESTAAWRAVEAVATHPDPSLSGPTPTEES